MNVYFRKSCKIDKYQYFSCFEYISPTSDRGCVTLPVSTHLLDFRSFHSLYLGTSPTLSLSSRVHPFLL